jgi:hypothetical protein
VNGQCSNCQRHRQTIVFANRHGERWCQACLAAYLAMRRDEAGLVVRPRKVVKLVTGATVRLDGVLPARVRIRGVEYVVSVPAAPGVNGNGKGHG